MNNKIGLVTLFRDNYGSELQCYATKTFLQKNGYECEVIYEYSYGIEKIKDRFKSLSKLFLYTLIYRDFGKNRREIKRSIKASSKSLTEESKFYLNWFCEAVLQPRGLEYSLLKDKRYENEYDYFIAGSDQIWGGGYLVRPFMFLEFAQDYKKIALCPSFGVETLKKFNIKPFRKSIAKFSKLSVREQSGQNIISELIGFQVPRISDPIMLLDSDEWHNFAESSSIKLKDYIFVHFLGKPSDHAIQYINKVAKILNIKIICFANEYEEYKQLREYSLFNGSPYEYVYLIENARYVCTDSFHTSHFSIIFNRKFITFERWYGHNNKQSTRIKNLFSIYKCSDRFANDDSVISEEMLYSSPNFDSIKKYESAAVRQYLLDSLQIKIKTQIEDELKNIKECTGCMACVAICPKKAISITYCKLGYRMPKIDSSKCVNCGLCIKVCKFKYSSSVKVPDNAYITYNINNELRIKSASGGTFSCLAKSFIEQGGVVTGSSLSFEDGEVTVKHIVVKKEEDIELLLGSKYVESDCSGVYQLIEFYLKSNISVLFCGTSCQVMSLYSYLHNRGVTIENLFTIDLVCHGVPGIKFFNDYIKTTKFKSSKISNFVFRTKNKGVIKYQFSGELKSNYSEVKNIQISAQNSSYYDLFLHNASYREQCYQCKYASDRKPGDVTIGDYFEAKDDYPELFTVGGALYNSDYLNCLLINSVKGQQLIEKYGKSLKMYSVSRKRIQLSHSNLCKPSTYGILRLNAMDKYQTCGFKGIETMYKKIFLYNTLILKLKKFLTVIKRIVHK